MGRDTGTCLFPDNGLRRIRGVTLVEVLIGSLVLFGFLGTIVSIQRFTMSSYRSTSWKQEKTRQIETFWNQLRRPLEEASDVLSRTPPTGSDWEIVRSPRPLKFRSRSSGENGLVMVWATDHLTSSGDLEYSHEYRLSLEGRRLALKGIQFGAEQKRILVEDVDEIRVRATNIRQKGSAAASDERFEEYLDTGGGSSDTIVGSIVEIAVTVTPGANSSLPPQKIVQNAKFKIPVGSLEDASL